MSLRILTGTLLLSAFACSRAVGRFPPGTPATSGVPECDGPIVIAVSPGLTPRFTWTPNCIIRSLAVQTTDERHANLWVVNTPEPGGIGSGVTYGVAPLGAKVHVGPQQLRFGQSYMVTVRNVTRAGAVIAAEGTVAFRP